MAIFKEEVNKLNKTLSEISEMVDIDKLKDEIIGLEEESQSEDLWKNGQKGSLLMKVLASKKSTVENIKILKDSINSYLELINESTNEDINQLESDSAKDLDILKSKIKKVEQDLQFSGEYDEHDALMTISGGAGGVDAQDWASMLLRMYLRWADKNKFKIEILTSSPGEEAGLKSALIRVSGNRSFGFLRGEKGVHRMVRLSPFNSANLRHTSFALVEIIPDFKDSVDVQINTDDLKIDATWKVNGQHYENTSYAWLENMDNNKKEIISIFNDTYGVKNSKMWFQRWRIFFLSCAVMFGIKEGTEWGVSHYRFIK